jgi:anthranilate/para-aminobenzoate synthase component I
MSSSQSAGLPKDVYKSILRQKDTVLHVSKPFWGIKHENNQTCVFSELANDGEPIWQVVNCTDPLVILEDFWEEKIHINDQLPILVGFLGYDFAKFLEKKLPQNKQSIFPFPSMCFMAFAEHNFSAISQNNKAVFKLPKLKQIKNLTSDSLYKGMIEEVLKNIEAGNVYEVNLSRPFLLELENEVDGYNLFANLSHLNPAPYEAYFPINSQQSICSASPECFIEKKGQEISTYPIKGTRKRSQNIDEDLQLQKELLTCTKELAEHLMVVDIERNDFGKIAIPGSVKVQEFAKLESFKFVHHLISKISGQLKPNLNIFDCLRATFPSGSITGAPKISTMQLINKLEPYSRSAYTGCLGYIDSRGDASFSILIRSLLVNKNQLLLNVGGGIVQDSIPDFEIEETYVKAQGFFELFR